MQGEIIPLCISNEVSLSFFQVQDSFRNKKIKPGHCASPMLVTNEKYYINQNTLLRLCALCIYIYSHIYRISFFNRAVSHP